MRCFPEVNVIHTDPDVPGRVYIPVVNWFVPLPHCTELIV